MLEWDIMPTDWSTSDVDIVCKLKTKFNGNPRYVEEADKFNKKSMEKTKLSLVPSIILNNEYNMEDEEHKKYIKESESGIFKDMSVFEAEETEWMETVKIILCKSYFTIHILFNITNLILKQESIVMDTKNTIKEEDRLAITVKIIDNESHIVPRGYFYKLPDGVIVKAPYFKGKVNIT